mgnify:CR=1 FL=1
MLDAHFAHVAHHHPQVLPGEALAAGDIIVVFPEGTRNFGEELLPFKKGAFQMAIAAGVPIIPVCVSSYAGRLQLNNLQAGEVIIRSLPALPTAGLSLDDLPALMAQCRQQMQQCIDQMDQQLQRP